MNKRLIKPCLGFLVVVGLATVVTGCGSCKPGKPGPTGRYTIEVTLADSLKTGSVLVDLVGVNSATLPRWEAKDMGEYWPESDMRRDADKKTLNFTSGQSPQTLPAADAQWNNWKNKGVTHVLVLADLPGAQVSKPGSQDARRLVLPLDECYWPSGTKTIKVLVQASGITPLTPGRPSK